MEVFQLVFRNGVSIDTDNVIYIENGPDFYTYTFRIDRENALENAPVENLVLSPLSDGSWKEELVTYNLTAQEKQTMLAGSTVDLKGKITKELLQSGTYAPQVMERVVCYDYVDAYYTTCSGGMHHNGEEFGPLSEGKCPEPTQSVLVITVTRRCNDIAVGGNDEGGTPSIPSEGGGNQGGGGTAPSTQPCEGNGVPSQPQDSNSTLGTNEGCNPGTPTLPNLEFNPAHTPCEKLKNNLQKAKEIIEQTDVKNKNDLMKANIMSDVFEKAFYWGKDSSGNLKTSNIVDGTVGNVTFGISGSQFAPEAYAHNHNGTGGYMDFSSTDIYAFHTFSSAFSTLKHNYANGSDGSQYVMTLENKTEFDAFVAAYPISTVDVSTDTYEGTGDWLEGVDIRTDEDLLLDYFKKQGKNANEAMDLTMGYLIKKYNMGIMISKKGTDGKFHPIQVELIINPFPGIPYAYVQVNPCNL